MTKQELRNQIKDAITSLGSAAIQAESEKLCHEIIESKIYRGSSTILAYMPLADEADISPVIQDALSRGKKVFLPRIFSGTNDMEFYRYTKDSATDIDQYGIIQPLADKAQSFSKFLERLSIQQYSPAAHSSDYVDIAEHDQTAEHILILVPGRAFTKDGRRLGRGKGFYDIYLSKIPQIFNIRKTGVCLKCQLLPNIPTTPDDIFMDSVFSS